MARSPRAGGKLGHAVGSLCKVWRVGRWRVRDGRGPQTQGFPQGPPPEAIVPVYAIPPLQDYSAIIELVETLQALPTCDVAEQHNVCFHYTFALNR